MGMNEAMNLHTRRKTERRELSVYFAAAFLVVLPLVMVTRTLDLFRGRVHRRPGSVIEETSSRVSTLLGFVFMA